MTVETTATSVTYTGTGTTGPFDFSFKVLEKTDLTITRRIIATGLVDKTFAQDEWEVEFEDVGGTITMDEEVTSDYRITIERVMPYTQLLSINNQSGFLPQVIEEAFDRQEMQIQQLVGDFGNTVKIPVDETMNELPGSAQRIGKFLAFDAEGEPIMSSGTGADAGLRTDLAANNGSGLVGVKFNAVGSVARTLLSKSADIITPKDFGAAGDGVTDDTAALQAWLNASGGVHELGDESKTYLVQPSSLNAVILHLPSGSARYIRGSGATIRIKSGSLGFKCIIGSDDDNDDLSNTVLDGLVFDYNKANNAYTHSGFQLTQRRYTFEVHKGSGIIVRNCVVKDAVCTNSLFINGHRADGSTGITDVLVINNTWLGIGAPPGDAVDYDHSTLYLVCDGASVFNNTANGSGLGATGAWTFCESHGSHITIIGNKVRRMIGFANITGIESDGDTEHVIVQHNTADVLEHGVRMLSQAYSDHTTGYGLNGIYILDNVFRIHQSALPAGVARFYQGVVLTPDSSLPTNNIHIMRNTIEYDLEGAPSAYTAYAPAIGMMDTDDTIVHSNWNIKDNLVINSPLMGIAAGLGGGVVDNWYIGPNTFINVGQSKSPAFGTDFRVGLWMTPAEITGSLIVEKQTLIDKQATSTLRYACWSNPTTDSSGIISQFEFEVLLLGATTTSYLLPFQNISDKLSPLVLIKHNKAFVDTAQEFRAGSRQWNTKDYLLHTVLVTGVTWTATLDEA